MILKVVFLTISLACGYSSILGQVDKGKTNFNTFKIEIGHSTSVFLNSQPTFLIKSNTPYFKPTFIKLTMEFKGSDFIFLDYKNYSSFEIENNWEMGDIWLRKYDVFDIGFGSTYYLFNSKLKVQPALMFSWRPNGTENVYVTPMHSSFPQEPLFNNYDYNSVGFGLGINLTTTLYKQFSLGFETQYNYFFESKKLRGKPITRFEEFEKNYKVNRAIITPIIKLGYDFNYKRKTKSSL